jgi:ABC-type proline/glycine betaine transport system ATPase subunit
MVEAVSTAAPKQFTTVQYNTKDGESITATKKDGVVTLVGDKSGVRKMPIEDFKKELVANVPHLEKTPAKDTVEISKDPTEVQDKDAKTPAEAKVKDAKVDSKEVKVADTKKAEEPAKAEKGVTTDKAPTEGKTPVEEAKKPEIGKKLDVAA